MFDNLFYSSNQQFVPIIKSYKYWCQARELLLSISLAGRMLASKPIHNLFSHPAALGFQAVTLPDNIELNAAIMTDQSIADWHWDSCTWYFGD